MDPFATDEHGFEKVDETSTRGTLDSCFKELIDHVKRIAAIASVSIPSKIWMNILNTTIIYNSERLEHFVTDRPSGQALLTVSNHVSAFDDPVGMSAMLPVSVLMRPHLVRWGLCATDRCFKNKYLGEFFSWGKVLPVERGAGLDQKGLRAAIDKLDHGDWVHIYPEGTRSRTGQMGPMRIGVGRLVTGPQSPPVILPFYHTGLEDVLPVGSLVPHFGVKVRVLVGEPIKIDDLLNQHSASEISSRHVLYAEIAARVGLALRGLRTEMNFIKRKELLQDWLAHNQYVAEQQRVGLDIVDPEGLMYGMEYSRPLWLRPTTDPFPEELKHPLMAEDVGPLVVDQLVGQNLEPLAPAPIKRAPFFRRFLAQMAENSKTNSAHVTWARFDEPIWLAGELRTPPTTIAPLFHRARRWAQTKAHEKSLQCVANSQAQLLNYVARSHQLLQYVAPLSMAWQTLPSQPSHLYQILANPPRGTL
mmetsp:Transcript_16092/g.26537  ORF Transcript_16092/g.26537 Transcript_16092/m.26537 type:complete len:475 (+) Transcript_16092:130-1554(+)